jgi:hypothetical protein
VHILILRFKPGHKVLVVDAGGGSIDISSYNVKSTSPLEVEEFQEPTCEGLPCNPYILTNEEIGSYQGGEVVTARFRDWAESKLKSILCCCSSSYAPVLGKLKKSNFSSNWYLKTLSDSFDNGTKKTFSDGLKTQYLRFGSPRDNDPGRDIKDGKLSLPGLVVPSSRTASQIITFPSEPRSKNSSKLPSAPSSRISRPSQRREALRIP